jgi:hypothetical protein
MKTGRAVRIEAERPLTVASRTDATQPIPRTRF